MTTDVQLQELLDREAIRELKARYFEAMDVHDWEAFRRTLTDDARLELIDRETWPLAEGIKAEPLDGADVFVAATSMALDSARTVHHGHTFEFAFSSPTEARGFLVLRDYVEWAPDPESGARRGMRGFGIYDESFRKVDGDWKISGWRLTYLRTDPLRRTPLPGPAIGGPEDEENMARVRAAYALFHSSPGGGGRGVQELVDREAIKELHSRYYRLADAHDFDGLRQLVTDDVQVDLAPGRQFDGAHDYVAGARGLVGDAVTVHHGHMPQIRIDSQDEARATWMFGAYVEWPSDPATRRVGRRPYGYHRGTYRKVDGEWKIAGMHQSYLRIDALPAEPLPELVPGAGPR
jgi:hypothetical protein